MSGPSHDPLLSARQTGYTRSGFGAQYHAYRPRPPAALIDALVQLARVSRPGFVVDLGSGTGISTGIWAPRAECVIGIEPLDEMRKIAEAGNRASNVRFRPGVAQETGLPDDDRYRAPRARSRPVGVGARADGPPGGLQAHARRQRATVARQVSRSRRSEVNADRLLARDRRYRHRRGDGLRSVESTCLGAGGAVLNGARPRRHPVPARRPVSSHARTPWSLALAPLRGRIRVGSDRAGAPQVARERKRAGVVGVLFRDDGLARRARRDDHRRLRGGLFRTVLGRALLPALAPHRRFTDLGPKVFQS